MLTCPDPLSAGSGCGLRDYYSQRRLELRHVDSRDPLYGIHFLYINVKLEKF